jgi:hypothetical protein
VVRAYGAQKKRADSDAVGNGAASAARGRDRD